MDKLKFIVFSFIILAVVMLIGYWAVYSIESGSEHTANQKIEKLQKENEDLKEEVESLKDELYVYKPKIEPSTAISEVPKSEVSTPKPETVKPTVYKHQSLINELQKLADDNVTLKLKSTGAKVGTVQKFLNIFNNTSNKVDNDYGAGTEKLVIDFQKDQGLTPDGEAGRGTFNKMIDLLKAQG